MVEVPLHPYCLGETERGGSGKKKFGTASHRRDRALQGRDKFGDPP